MMRFASQPSPRHGAFFLIALFSCLQILFGFFLFTSNGQDSVVPARSSLKIVAYDSSPYNIADNTVYALATLEPAAGDTTDIDALQNTTIKARPYNTDNNSSTFLYFWEYRQKAKTRQNLTP